MRLVDVLFSDPDNALEARVDFKYSPIEGKARKWVDIVSLRKNDEEAAFVFRINQQRKFFQLYFGNGYEVQGNIKIDATGFFGRDSTLKYIRSSNFSVLSLECADKKEVRFVAHKGQRAADVSLDNYREGNASNGIELHKVSFSNIPESDVSLDVAKRFVDDPNVPRTSDYCSALNALGAEYFSLSEYDKAVAMFERGAITSDLTINMAAFRKARTCIGRAYGAVDREKAWRRFSTPEDEMFGEARQALAEGGSEAARSAFLDAVEQVFRNPPYQFNRSRRETLVEAFSSLVGGGERQSQESLPRFSRTKVAIVSGMGWSGSGAVYDYLREYDGVVAIKGETPYIEGSRSLSKIYSSLNDSEQLKEDVFDFFFYALLGHCIFRNSDDFKLFKFARSKLMSESCDHYLNAVREWCLLASAMYSAAGTEREKLFSMLSDYTVSKFTIGREIPAGKVALLDNVVHIENAGKCINFLNNVSIFCTFRDPRSNYVALVREAIHFSSSAPSYVKNRKKSIARSRQSADAAKLIAEKGSGKVVEIVNFEEFVLSEAYRKKLAENLGLAASEQEKYKYFKPWESMRNVVLHQEHPNQDEIQLIEKELGEYCYEPCIRPLLQDA